MNPQTQLFELLAESNIRARSIREIHDRSIQSIEQRYNALAAQVKQMRGQLAAHPELKPKYEKAILNLRRLAQSYAMGASRPTVKRSPVPPSDRSLEKALNYGELLLEIYGDGDSKPLIKGAAIDLETCANYLMHWNDPRSIELAQKLRNIG